MHPFAALARRSVEEFVRTGKRMACPRNLPPELSGQAGVFVCLKKAGSLRGCIGTFHPCASSLAEEIMRNAVSAATQDPRFEAVSEDELGDMEYSVDVLSPPERIGSLQDLDPKIYGVIVMQGERRGLLLPDLEGVDTVEEQLRIVRMKAGIQPGEDVEIFRFTVERYS